MRPLIAVAGAEAIGSGVEEEPISGSLALRRSGGLGAIVPSGADAAEAADWIARVDGLLLTGRLDAAVTDDPLVVELVRLAVARELPVLGVGGGLRLLNEALGGTDEPGERRSTVRLAPGSVVASALGTTAPPLAEGTIVTLGTGLVPAGWSPEGAVKAVEHARSWALGLPWSPRDSTAAETVAAGFAAFVERSRAHRDHERQRTPLTACRTSEAVVEPDIARTVDLLVDRVLRRLHDIGAHLLDRYVAEVVDYRALGEKTLRDDVLPTAERTVEDLLAAVRAGASIDEERLEGLRRSARRRAGQGISLQDLLHAYRLWGRVVWDEILTSARGEIAAERDAVLWLAGRVMIYVDRVSSAVAQTYLDEVTGVRIEDGTLRGDLLESLISGERLGGRKWRQASAARLDPAATHAVLVVRPAEPGQVRRAQLRHALAGLRQALHPRSGTVLLGVREDEAVAIYPLPGDSRATETIRAQAESWADDTPGFVVGIGCGHAGYEGIAPSYAEAQEAAHTVEAGSGSSRVVPFSRVLVEHVLRTSAHSEAVVEEAIAPLRAYDDARGAELVRTLRTYFTHGFNLARSAVALHVTSNTVGYRLGRIRDLTGRDPADPDDLLVLVLGLKIVGAEEPETGS